MTDAPAWLPAGTWALITQTVDALGGALGPGLHSAMLVGSAMNPARGDRARAPEVIAVVSPAALGDLAKLAAALAKPMRAGVRVRVLTRTELERSCDVFALELAEWKARHLLLRGDDPFASLRWTPEDLRRALEAELRGLSRRIRNRVLTGLATDRHRDDPRQAVIDGTDRLAISAYHTLRALGATPPDDEPGLLRALAARCSGDAEPLIAQLGALRGRERAVEPTAALAALLALVEPAIELVDRWTPGDAS